MVCPGCGCFGTHLASFEIKRLPGFAMFTCRGCDYNPHPWIVCTKCPRNSLQFKMLVQEADNTLVFEKYKCFRTHLKNAKLYHADIERPFPQSIPLPQCGGAGSSINATVNETDCTTITSFLPPPNKLNFRKEATLLPNKRPKLLSEETKEPSSCLRNFTKETALLSQQQNQPYECSEEMAELPMINNSGKPLEILCDWDINNHPDVSCFSRFKTKEFLLYSRTHKALQVAVNRAFYKDDWKNKDGIQGAEIIAFLKFVRLLIRQSENGIKEFIVPMFQKQKQFVSKGESESEKLPPFKTYNDIRSRVFEGPNAFLNNLPLVMPEKVKGGNFAYLSVIENFALILHTQTCQNLDIIKRCPEKDTVRLLSESKYAQQLYDPEVEKHLLMVAWQDGFSGNGSQTNKSQRFKVWAKTATLVPAERQRGGTLHSECKNTVLVAVGLEKNDKTNVEQKFFEELKTLDTKGGITFYDASEGRNITVRISPLAFKADQPERRKLIGWAQTGSSNFGKQMGVVGDWKAIHENIPSCDNCLRALLYEKQVVEDCPNCLNWDVRRKDSKLTLFKKPGKYPKSEDPETEELRFKEQTFEKMIEAANKTHDMLYTHQWSKGEAECYLNTQGFSNVVAKEIIKKACNMACFDSLDQLSEEEQKTWREYQELSPDLFQKHVLPPILSSGFKMEQIVPLLMHLLFLGIVKTVLCNTILMWLKKEKIATPFEAKSKGILESIASLNVEWCKPQPYDNGQCGQWVSENHMAIARLLPWFYQSLTEINDREEVALKPYDIKNAKCWNKTDCKEWLGRHGITPTEGDVQKQVHHLMVQPGGPPDREYNKPSPEQAQMLLQSVTAMVSRLMAKSATKESIGEVHRHVLIFLSYYHRFDDDMKAGLRKNIEVRRQMIARQQEKDKAKQQENDEASMLSKGRGKESKPQKRGKNGLSSKPRTDVGDALLPTWMGTNNFADLPRLKFYMEQFGPLINLWEGDSSGEKFIQLIKKDGKLSGQRKNWEMNCAQWVQKRTSMAAIDQMPEMKMLTEGEQPPREERHGKHKYHPYKSRSQIEQSISNNKPLSGFLTKDNEFGLCVEREREQRATVRMNYIVLRQAKFELTKSGLAYHRWELDTTDQGVKLLNHESVARYLLFLPILTMDQNNNGLLTVISHDWKILDRDLNFIYLEVDHWIDDVAEQNSTLLN